MAYIDELRFFWNMIWKPDKGSKRQLDLGSAIRLYYTLAVIPFIAYAIIGSIVVALGVGSASLGTTSAMGLLSGVITSISYLSVFWGGIVLFFILIPLGIAIDAAIYQVIAKTFLNAWKGTYDRTFAAMVYGIFPVIMLLWLSLVPLFNSIYIIIAPIWGIIIFVIALSTQQRITRLNALLIVVLKSLLVIAVITLIGISVFSSLTYLIGSALQYGNTFIPWGNLTMSGWHLGQGPYTSYK